MTPTHNDSPSSLRRSGGGVFRTPLAPPPRHSTVVVVNDDEKERREARRRTILNDSVATSTSTIEDNEQLKECLKICTENKLTKENAWSISLIDTLSSLLSKHHKSLSNFKVAGSSLEASTKIYGLRVDSVHMDVIRMSAGLHKEKGTEVIVNDDNDNEISSEVADNQNPEEAAAKPKPKKKQKRQVSTVTKNKDTINGKLDTNPFTDPVFAKLNSIVGSINSSNRLMQNILPSLNSELRSKTDYKFWSSEEAVGDWEGSVKSIEDLECDTVSVKCLDDVSLQGTFLRPNHTGYIITDLPAEQDESEMNNDANSIGDHENTADSQMEMAFDINAVVEPIVSEETPFLDVDMDDFTDLTVDQQKAISNCKGLRRNPVMIEDMRPVDLSSSKLEYSYRPLDKISQFWAGPSHWKFKRSINKSITLSQRLTMNEKDQNVKINAKRKKPLKLQPLLFTESNNDPFINIDDNSKIRKSNIQKKWDSKKFKLPTDLQFDRDMFDRFQYAIGFRRIDETEEISVLPNVASNSDYEFNNATDQDLCNSVNENDNYPAEQINDDCTQLDGENEHGLNQTYAEISINFDNAPDKVEKIIVPFSKRAKVIDMKQLKKSCTQLVQNEFIETNKENIPTSDQFPSEQYLPGMSSFNKVYKNLPKLLNQNMSEALSPTIAFYAILHLANETNFRLFQQDNLEDFKIRKVKSNTEI